MLSEEELAALVVSASEWAEAFKAITSTLED
jgi:hypothetical protein